MSHDFTKRKFLSLEAEQKHKKCAELLRCAYDKLLDGDVPEDELSHYAELASWLGLDATVLSTLKEVSDRYHLHAQAGDVHHKEHRLLPHIKKGDKEFSDPVWNVAIYLDNLRSAHNVGSILRTVEAFALGTVYFSPGTPSPTHKQVKDAAMGTADWVTCRSDVPLKDLPRPIIVLETAENAVPIHEFPFPDTFTLVVGNEEYGCSDSTLLEADAFVHIPLRGRKNSLNVANAFAIAAAAISFQK